MLNISSHSSLSIVLYYVIQVLYEYLKFEENYLIIVINNHTRSLLEKVKTKHC